MLQFVVEGLITIIGLIIGFLIKDKINTIEKNMQDLQMKYTGLHAEMLEFKDNYLDRFEKINKNISESKLEILKEFHIAEMHLLEKINEHRQ
jgi:archaellum component FlaC